MSIAGRLPFKCALFVSLVAAAMLGDRSLGATGADESITVGSNVHVSSANANVPHYEVMLAEDPGDPARFLACSIIAPPGDGYQYETVVYLSTNGGLSWRPTLQTHDTGSGDPACAFGTAGEAYFAELQEAKDADGHQRGHTFIYVSRDGGATWGLPRRLRQADREYITVDDTNGPRRGRVYVNAAMSTRSYEDDPSHSDYHDESNGFGLLVSGDRGATFELETLLNPAPTGWTFADGNGIVMPNGTYAAIVPVVPRSDDGSRTFHVAIDFVTSSNGGETFTKAVTIRNAVEPSGPLLTTTWIPSLAVDQSAGPFHGRLYVVWAEQIDGRSQIFIAYSSDNGSQWSAPVTVNDDVVRSNGTGPDDSEPIVAVNSRGIVGVTWYDRRDSWDDLGSYERFSASLDGGETFLPSVRVATSPTRFDRVGSAVLEASASGGGDRFEFSRGGALTVAIGYNSRFAFIGGDTEGLVADESGTFHALWVDNRTGIPQVWTAPITVEGQPALEGSAELAAMADVTDRVTVVLDNAHFDSANSTVTVEAEVVNTSAGTIAGPIVGRFVTLTSRLGRVTIEDSDNGLSTPGAIVRFASLDENLQPDEHTAGHRLVFHLANMGNVRSRVDAASLEHFVDFTLKMYARRAVHR
jgi:hypothetical protein